jgi:hypothetical protein
MSLLKEADERALDELTSATVELIERLDMFVSLHPEDDPFHHLILKERTALEAALSSICTSLQQNGYIPASGNIEMAELGAVAAIARAAVSTETEVDVMAKSLNKDIDRLQHALRSATAETGPAHPASDEIAHLGARVHEVRETLSRFLPPES